MTSRPDAYTIRKYTDPKSAALHAVEKRFGKEERHEFEFQGVGWNWEADAVARCLRGISTSIRSLIN